MKYEKYNALDGINHLCIDCFSGCHHIVNFAIQYEVLDDEPVYMGHDGNEDYSAKDLNKILNN